MAQTTLASHSKNSFKQVWWPWIMVILVAIFYCYDFLLRVAPSVMIHELMRHYQVFATEIGFLSAFYYYAYTPMQIPVGLILDSYSARGMLTFAVALCVIGTLLFAAVPYLFAAFLGRLLMGFGSAFAFVGTLKLASIWLPANRFGFIAGLTTGLGTIGAMAADLGLSRLVVRFDWQTALYLTAIFGGVITILIWLVVRDKPTHNNTKTIEYRSWSHMRKRLVNVGKNWRFWVNGLIGCFSFMPVSVFASLWGVAFIAQAYQLRPHHAASSISLLFFGAAIGSPMAGWLSDWLLLRRLPLFISLVFSTIIACLILYVTAIPLLLADTLLFLLGIGAGGQILVFAIGREISPHRSTGTAVAGTNFIITMGAAVFQPLIGYLLDLKWQHIVANGIPVFTVSNYQFAISVIPIFLALGALLVWFLPETHCANIYERAVYPKRLKIRF